LYALTLNYQFSKYLEDPRKKIQFQDGMDCFSDEAHVLRRQISALTEEKDQELLSPSVLWTLVPWDASAKSLASLSKRWSAWWIPGTQQLVYQDMELEASLTAIDLTKSLSLRPTIVSCAKNFLSRSSSYTTYPPCVTILVAYFRCLSSIPEPQKWFSFRRTAEDLG
jgi:hypothetical protein